MSKFVIKRMDGPIPFWLQNAPTDLTGKMWTENKEEAKVFHRQNDAPLFVKAKVEKRFGCKVEVENLL